MSIFFRYKFRSMHVISLVVGISVLVHFLLFGLILLKAPLAMKIQYIPDDAFYYLQLAKNFVRFNTWTFDNGESVTSGFHPLWAYVLVLVYWLIRPSTTSFVTVALFLSIFISLITVTWFMYSAVRIKKISWLLVGISLISSRNFFMSAISVMEWSLTVCFSALYCYVFYRCLQNTKKYQHGVLFVLGFLGTFSRLDFGLTALSMFVAAIILSRKRHSIMPAAGGLFGAIFAVIVALGLNYYFTGEFLQSSARIKLFWAQYYQLGSDIVPYMLSLTSAELYLLLLVCLIPLYIILALLKKQPYPIELFIAKKWKLSYVSSNFIMVGGAIISFIGYSILYGHNGAIQSWYTASLIAPIFILAVSGGEFFISFFKIQRIIKYCIFLTVVLAVLRNMILIYPINSAKAPWPHQLLSLQAHYYIEAHPLEGKLGSSNAGVLGYFQKGKVINLDGLVNNDIYPYAITNTLPLYIQKKNIRYISDHPIAFSSKEFMRSRGYDDQSFLNRLQEVVTIHGDYSPYFSRITIYKIGN